MATSTIKNKNIIARITDITLDNTMSLNANSGKPLSSFKSYSITVPTGYKILTHADCWMNGQTRILVNFDTNNLTTSTPPIYLFNVTGGTKTFNNTTTVRVLTLFEPK